MYQAGLILEGGGMKGLYTAGILDYFLDKEMSFSSCYGVSAGAIQMCNFISKDKGRGLRTGLDYLDDKRYCGMYSFLTTGDFVGADFCYRKIPFELDPIDNETYLSYEGKAYAGMTNIITGEVEYYQVKDMTKDIVAIQASSSLPILSRNVMINGVPYLDGGIVDCIPIKQSIKDGNAKHVVILTKEIGYVRTPSSFQRLIRLKYRKYPKVYENIKKRHDVYNETMKFIEAEEKAGRIYVIRPEKDLNVGRLEKDADKLKAIYHLGYEDAAKHYESLMKYLQS